MPAESAWGDVVDEDETSLPEPVITVANDVKTVVEYKINSKTGKREKHTSTYKISKKIDKVNKAMLERKNWAKFGDCKDDGPGIQDESVNIQEEEIFLILTSRSETLDDEVQPEKKVVRASISCSICKGPHFTSKCPDRELYASRNNEEQDRNRESRQKSGLYVPPARKGGREGGASDRRSNDGMTVRVSNLPEDTRESDLQELFGKCGRISRLTLARDRQTQVSKGYAHIGFHRREEAAYAIERLNGYGYGHLVLQVEWPRERD